LTIFDRHVLAERTATVERHLARVEAKLPSSADALQPSTDASDAVLLHLWQAVQIVIDLGYRCACGSIWERPRAMRTPSRSWQAPGIWIARSPSACREQRAFAMSSRTPMTRST
jgi:hypothetical protein